LAAGDPETSRVNRRWPCLTAKSDHALLPPAIPWDRWRSVRW